MRARVTIPGGLELLADAAVANGRNLRPAGGGASRTSFAVAFLEIVKTDGAGVLILSSADHTSHLADANAATANGCPGSHPYRNPQVTYKLDYAVPYPSGWYLSSGCDARSPTEDLTAGFIAGWDTPSMELMMRCTIELLDHCEFAGSVDGRRVSRSQLPERFIGQDGAAVYTGSTTLVPGADRTLFGTAVRKFS